VWAVQYKTAKLFRLERVGITFGQTGDFRCNQGSSNSRAQQRISLVPEPAHFMLRCRSQIHWWECHIKTRCRKTPQLFHFADESFWKLAYAAVFKHRWKKYAILLMMNW